MYASGSPRLSSHAAKSPKSIPPQLPPRPGRTARDRGPLWHDSAAPKRLGYSEFQRVLRNLLRDATERSSAALPSRPGIPPTLRRQEVRRDSSTGGKRPPQEAPLPKPP